MAQENAQVKSTVVEQDAAAEQEQLDAAGQLTRRKVVEQGKRSSKGKAPVNKTASYLMAMGPGLLAAAVTTLRYCNHPARALPLAAGPCHSCASC